VSVMRVILLYPYYTKFEVCIGLVIPKIWLIFGHGVKKPSDLDL